MGSTLIEKILAAHASVPRVCPGDVINLAIDARVARDFGGANVVKGLVENGLEVADPAKTFFTFDCNPGGSDQGYAANQQRCRVFAGERGIKVHDINRGIGTHVAIETGTIYPGGTLVSTDSHANILGAIGAFGQGMGDSDIAAAFAFGSVWFKVPRSIRVVFKGRPAPDATAKDLVLAAMAKLGAEGLLGCAAEFVGEPITALDLAGRLTVASLATEMGAIIALIEPDGRIVEYCRSRSSRDFEPVRADADATYEKEIEIDVTGLSPRISRPGHPEDVVAVSEQALTRVDSVFIGSCTNGRFEDLKAAAEVLRGRTVAQGVVLKVVPATDEVWRQCMASGLFEVFKAAGALIGNAGCAGCAAGQIGMNGPGEVTVSTGNRNFAGKQGAGQVYLASPETAAASAVAGTIVTATRLREGALPVRPERTPAKVAAKPSKGAAAARPEVLKGRAWVLDRDSIDTDMIYHNKHLAETDPAKMGRHAFGNLPGWEDFPTEVKRGDILVTGANFGCGSSRQQAVSCFVTLGVSVLVGRSFGAIYERNSINEALPVLVWDWKPGQVETGDELLIELVTGRIENLTKKQISTTRSLSPAELSIYRRGGLLKKG